MAYDKNQDLSHVFKQELGYDYIELEFILEEKTKESPKVEIKESEITDYALGPKISRKELRQDRRKRQKSFIKFDLPYHSNVMAPSERRMFR
jgi:hypothetical protein